MTVTIDANGESHTLTDEELSRMAAGDAPESLAKIRDLRKDLEEGARLRRVVREEKKAAMERYNKNYPLMSRSDICYKGTN